MGKEKTFKYLFRKMPLVFRRFDAIQYLPIGIHEHAELIYVRRGKILVTVDDIPYQAGAGSMMLVAPFDYHSFHPITDDPVSFDVIVFDSRITPEIESIFREHVPKKRLITDHELTPLIRLLFDTTFSYAVKEYGREPLPPHFDIPFSEAEVGRFPAYITVLMREILNLSGVLKIPERNLSSMQRVITYCYQNYTQDISRDSLAKALSLSPNTISLAFSKIHTTLRDYLNYLRVCHAHRLLITTDLPISEIMEESGYQNQGTFNRKFMEQFGKSPREVRKANTEA